MASIDNLADEIAKSLTLYTAEVTEELEKVKKKVTRDGVKRLREGSPKDSGRYAAGWTMTQQDGALIIHNKNKPQLTHLLEYGHAKRTGGRVAGKRHIEPVEAKIVEEFENAVEKVVRG